MFRLIDDSGKRETRTLWGRFAVLESSKIVAILSVLAFGASVSPFVNAATTVSFAEVSTLESASLYDDGDYEDDEDEEEEEDDADEIESDAEKAPKVRWDAPAIPLESNALEQEESAANVEERKSSFRVLIDKFDFGATVTTVGQHSNFGATDSGIDGSLMVEVKAKAKLTERDTVRATFKAGMGEGLGGRIPSFCGFNGASGAARNIYLNQLWYERKLDVDGKWRARVGYLDLTSDFDQNAYANDEYTQFLSDAFINNLTFECPANSLGGQLWWEPNDKWCFGVGYSESNRDCVEMFSYGVAIAEIDRRVQIGELEGTYRGYFTANFGPHDALDGSRDDLVNDGWGLSFDQEISKYVGLWGRYGQQNGACCEFDRALTGGFELHSFSEERPDDILGFGYGITCVSDEFAALNEGAVDENHFELYYSFQVNEYFSATPSLQWIDGVGGDGEAEVVWAPGFRATVAF